MKYFLLAGEKSGDLHGANLIKEIKLLDPEARIQAWGGDSMEKEGALLLMHHSELAIMGILGILKNLQKLKSFFRKFSQSIDEFQPDTIIFIDYGGFNLKAAKIAKLRGFHTQFYIAPKVWAWNKGRISTIKRWIDELYVIFPFEEKLFSAEGISTHYVGNPLNDSISNFQPNPNFLIENKLNSDYIALLPGSRHQEVSAVMPIFNELKKIHADKKFIVAGLKEFESLYEGFQVIYDNPYQVLYSSKCAIVTSGTATLETALLNIPQIVVYKTDWLFYSLAKLMIKIDYISLVNIILNKLAVPELIQADFNSAHITPKLEELTIDSETRLNQLADYKKLKDVLGLPGASKKTAKLLVNAAANQLK
jgi:lipid-A-disaccharide synthase